MQASAVTINEMKDKVVTLSTEVEQLQSEVLYKEKVLSKMHVDYEASVKGRSAIRDDITKCSQVWKEKKVQFRVLTFCQALLLFLHVLSLGKLLPTISLPSSALDVAWWSLEISFASERDALGEQLVAEEQELEVINLEDIINKAEKDMVTARKRYGLAVKNRNTIGILLIDRNDELCILYEKCNVQVLTTECPIYCSP